MIMGLWTWQKFFLLPVVIVLCAASAALAQEDAAADGDQDAKEKPKPKMLVCRVRVVDPEGYPIEDATVFCTGMRVNEEPGSHWGWSDERWGKAPRIQTNAEGVAEMPYPEKIAGEFTIGQMTWSVEHPDFTNYREDHSVEDDPADIRLEGGFRIALTAKRGGDDDGVGEKITKDLYAVGSFSGGGKWELKKNGTLVSSVLKKQDGLLRVVCFEEDKPTLFSKEIKVQPGDKSRVLLKDIGLSAGCRVDGEICDLVERPIEDGYVMARVCKFAGDKRWQSGSWSWSDKAEVSADGKFVFESLPTGEVIQLIPFCDGWVPEKPEAAAVAAKFVGLDIANVKRQIASNTVTPHVFSTDGSGIKVTLPMVKAGELTVKVVDPVGNPIAGAKVVINPNQCWFNSGSQIYGSYGSTKDVLQLRRAGADLRMHFGAAMHPFQRETGPDGTVVLRSVLPGARSVRAYSESCEMQKDLSSGYPEKRIVIREANLERSLVVTLYPKGAAPEAGQNPIETGLEFWRKAVEALNRN